MSVLAQYMIPLVHLIATSSAGENQFCRVGYTHDEKHHICYKLHIEGENWSNGNKACGQEGYVWKKETGHCYKFHNVADTWKGALGTCISENAYLTIINSKEESKVVKDIFEEKHNTAINSEYIYYAHIGFIDWEKDRKWFTIDGTPLENSGFVDWDTNEPNNRYNIEYCGSLSTKGFLNDISCNQRAAFICEKAILNI